MINLTRREAEVLLADLHHLIIQTTLARRVILDAALAGSIPFDPTYLAAAVNAVEDSLARLDTKGEVNRG